MNPIFIIKKIWNNYTFRDGCDLLLSRFGHMKHPFSGYIRANTTIRAANEQRLSICDYVEQLWDEKGVTEMVIDKMNQCGVLDHAQKICEIGPGTGIFLEKTLKSCTTPEYVFYEVADDWSNYLEKTYPVKRRNADGQTLKDETDFSCDLVHAHGVFTTIHFLYSFNYMKEMIRVTKRSGYIVFDFFCEDSMSGKYLEQWLSTLHWLPGGILPSRTVKDLFYTSGCILIDEFDRKYGASFSRYYIFRKS